MKTALVLEGGGMRGMYTAAIMDVMIEQNIYVDAIMGVSAGALVGINYKTRQNGRVIRYNKTYASDRRYIGVHSLLTTGNILNEEFCFDVIPKRLDPLDYEMYRTTPEDFYAVVTNLRTGRPEYHLLSDLYEHEQVEFLRASGSLPFVSKPVKVDGEYYLDGGITDSVPIEKVLSMGFERVIVVLTRPKEYRKKPGSQLPAKMIYGKYPAFVDAINQRWIRYNAQMDLLEMLEEEKRIFALRPSRYIKVGRLEKNPDVLQEMYNLGRADVEEEIQKMRDYLK